MTVIITVTLPKCGACQFAQKFDDKDCADCFGSPPTVHVLGVAGQDMLGRTAIRIETFVPRVHKERPACALFKPTHDFTTAGNS